MNEKTKTTSRVEVLGPDITKPPYYKGDDATTIVIRDKDGKPMLLIVNLLEDTWGVSASTDHDWKTVLERFGID